LAHMLTGSDDDTPVFDYVNTLNTRGYCRKMSGDRAGAECDLRKAIAMVSSASAKVRETRVTIPDIDTGLFQPKPCGPLLDEIAKNARYVLEEMGVWC
jgi:hypothetical protein